MENAKETPCLCALSETGLIHVTGKDAERFLHNQLSYKIEGLQAVEAPLAAWHDSKGRVRALLRVLVLHDGWLLLVHKSQTETLITQMSGFTLREDVVLQNVTDEWYAAALVAKTSNALETCIAEYDIALSQEYSTVIWRKGVAWVRIGPGLVHIFCPRDQRPKILTSFSTGSSAVAKIAEIRLGIPSVTREFEACFIPHLLNLDTLGAVVFDKGCYPGQEIIARAQNLGTVKRRMFRFSMKSTHTPAPSTPLEDSGGTRHGEILCAASQDGLVEMLAVVSLEGAKKKLFIRKKTDLTAIKRELLPYACAHRGGK